MLITSVPSPKYQKGVTEKIANLLYEEIGKRIRKQREDKQVTQEVLSAYVGVSRASISNIELGRQQTPVSVLYAIAERLATEITELLPSMSELLVLANKEVGEIEGLLYGRNDYGDQIKQAISDIIRKPNNDI